MLTPEKIARVCHEANRVLQSEFGEQVSLPWYALDEESQRSVIDGVLNAQSGATPEQSHENWVRFKEEHGWIWGAKKDLELKTHPCLVPYSELPEIQRVKDELFTSIVNALS